LRHVEREYANTVGGPKRGIDGRDIERFRERARGGDLVGANKLLTSYLSIDLTHSPVTLDFMKV
jgi:hypothetical protein